MGSDFGKLTKIRVKILDDVYIKMLTYSLGNGIKGVFFLFMFSKSYKISNTRFLLAFMKVFFLICSAKPPLYS